MKSALKNYAQSFLHPVERVKHQTETTHYTTEKCNQKETTSWLLKTFCGFEIFVITGNKKLKQHD